MELQMEDIVMQGTVWGSLKCRAQQDKLCSLGCKVQEDEEHLINCKYLVDQMSDSSILAEIELSDVFGTLQEQKQIAEAFVELLKIREKLTSEN